ncbi:hypothetical protein [Deinococcus aquaticus]
MTGTPRPGTPQVITDLGSGNASVPTLNELDSFVQAQDRRSTPWCWAP